MNFIWNKYARLVYETSFYYVQFCTLMFLAHISMLCDYVSELEKLEVAEYQNGIKVLVTIKKIIPVKLLF